MDGWVTDNTTPVAIQHNITHEECLKTIGMTLQLLVLSEQMAKS
jgi:hypothetical protein